jgi:hypothetical protein
VPASDAPHKRRAAARSPSGAAGSSGVDAMKATPIVPRIPSHVCTSRVTRALDARDPRASRRARHTPGTGWSVARHIQQHAAARRTTARYEAGVHRLDAVNDVESKRDATAARVSPAATPPIANKTRRARLTGSGGLNIFVRSDQFRNKFVLYVRSRRPGPWSSAAGPSPPAAVLPRPLA